MIHYVLTQHFEQTAAEVYDFVVVHQPENQPRFEPEVIELRHYQPPAPGSRALMVRRDFGKVKEVPIEFVEVIANRRTRFVANSDGVTLDFAFDFEPAGSGCDLRVTVEVTLSGMMRLFQPILARKFKKNSKLIMTRISKLMSAPYAAPIAAA